MRQGAVRTNALLILTILASGRLLLPTAYGAGCRAPNQENLLHGAKQRLGIGEESYFPDLRSMAVITGRGKSRIEWLGLAWDAPTDGAIFVLDCEGGDMAALRVGGVSAIKRGPRLPHFGRTMVVLSVTGTGTGYLEKAVRILAFTSNKIICLWSHTAADREFDLQRHNFVETFQWRFDKKGKRIRVFGQRLEFHPDLTGPATVVSLPAETYCFTSAGSYKRCRN